MVEPEDIIRFWEQSGSAAARYGSHPRTIHQRALMSDFRTQSAPTARRYGSAGDLKWRCGLRGAVARVALLPAGLDEDRPIGQTSAGQGIDGKVQFADQLMARTEVCSRIMIQIERSASTQICSTLQFSAFRRILAPLQPVGILRRLVAAKPSPIAARPSNEIFQADRNAANTPKSAAARNGLIRVVG
jgi:hypothetical protein